MGTSEAVSSVMEVMNDSLNGRRAAVAVSIRNAFNSMLGSRIQRELVEKEFPEWLRCIVWSYLEGRTVRMRLSSGVEMTHAVSVQRNASGISAQTVAVELCVQ